MGILHQRYKTLWTPEFWRQWREADSPYRRYKSKRDRHLALKLLRLHEGERVLEIGCGYGWISQALVESTKIQWIGVDISRSMMLHCINTIPDASGAVADTLFLPFNAEVFDVVLCNGVLMHVEDDLAALVEIARVLRPGGRVVISVNNLFSPFAFPLWLGNLRKLGVIKQSFRSPFLYRRWLGRLGFRVERIFGDTVLAVGLHLPGGILFPPKRWFKLAVLPDHWVESALRYFAYEIWFAAVKQPCQDGK